VYPDTNRSRLPLTSTGAVTPRPPHHGREAAQKRFWMKDDHAGRTGRVCDGTFLGAELQVKVESRHGEAGQDATRWWSVQPDPATTARCKTLNFADEASAIGL
jgi:hypothetical protein